MRFSLSRTQTLGKIGVEIMLSYGLERKKGFEDDKIVNFVKVQNMDIFQRG